MKPGITNLNRWTEKLVDAIRGHCQNVGAPCVGFGLVFFDPITENLEKQWRNVIRVAIDPHSDHPETWDQATKEKIETVLQFMTEGIKRILGGEIDVNELQENIEQGTLH